MIRIVTGGQTGADQVDWRAARRAGLPTGGWMPKGFETEEGPRPDFAREYGAVEADGGYKVRTRANARDSEATVWFGDPTSPGGVATLRACAALGRPVLVVERGVTRPSELAGWIVRQFVRVLNVAGNRESSDPGIGARVEAFLVATLRRLDSGTIPTRARPAANLFESALLDGPIDASSRCHGGDRNS